MDDRPIGQTPLGDPQSSVLTMQTLEDVDVDAVCNGAPTPAAAHSGCSSAAAPW
jgi:hypothetical protein